MPKAVAGRTSRKQRNDAPALAGAALDGLDDGWRELLARTPSSLPATLRQAGQAPSDGALGMLFHIGDVGGVAVLEVAPIVLARNAGGEVIGSEPLAAGEVPGARLSDPQRDLLHQFWARPHELRKGRAYVRMQGAGTDNLLSAMLRQAHCYLGGIAGFVLHPGPPAALHWYWQVLEDGRQALQVRRLPSRRLLRVERLWYIEVETGQAGVLEDPFGAFDALALPPLEPAQAAVVAAALPASRLADALPLPQVFGPAQVLDQVPRAALTFSALLRHPRLAAGMPPLAFAGLSFDYAGLRIVGSAQGGTTRRVRKDRLLEVRRHRAEELAALERLEQVGLVPAVDCEGLPWELTEALPDHAWLFPGAGSSGALEVNTPTRWLGMRARLEAEGFVIDYADSFPFEVLDGDQRWFVRAVPGRKQRDFRLELGIEVDGKRLNLLPAASTALAAGELDLEPAAGEPADATWYAPVGGRRRVAVSLSQLRSLLRPLSDCLERPRRNLRLPWGQAGRIDELQEALPEDGLLQVPESLEGLAGRLREAARRVRSGQPSGFAGRLRPYQEQGLHWLNALAQAGLGGVLADDMGLGKTVQVIAHILALRGDPSSAAPVLVVAPTSVLPNWEAELARYAPGLSTTLVHGPQRAGLLEQLDGQDVVLTSYALLPRDLKHYRDRAWSLLVLDEAQQVKNPRTHARRAARKLQATRTLCLTGTPLENHLGELWSQIDLAVPGLLGSEQGFAEHYRQPIEKAGDELRLAQLRRRIAPFILRRTKAEVARDLPPKTEITHRVVLGERQRALYEDLQAGLYEDLHAAVAERGIERSGIVVLDALLKLRQVCCDPRLLPDGDGANIPSAKLGVLMEILPALLAEGRRILLFSQFTSMLDLIAPELDARGIEHVRLTGQTRDRSTPIDAFQEGRVPLFLLSLKAGGVGLNLTAADTVIHYDPWWNPAAEDQASDRAHRIGQDKPVFVYRLTCVDTVEERIEVLKARKAELAAATLAGGGSRDHTGFSEEDLETLFGSG